MAIRKTERCVFQWHRKCGVALIVAGPMCLATAAVAEDAPTSDHTRITKQQQQATSQTILQVAGAEKSQRGAFSWFRRGDSQSAASRPSLFDRMRGRDNAPAAEEHSVEPRQGLMGRLTSPFRNDDRNESADDANKGDPSLDHQPSQPGAMPLPPPPAPAAARSAQLDNVTSDREQGVSTKYSASSMEETSPPGLVPLPTEDVFDAPTDGQSVPVPETSVFDNAGGTPATEIGPPPAPAANAPPQDLPEAASETLDVPPPADNPSEAFEEGPSLNAVPEAAPAETTFLGAGPSEDARYVALTRKLAERQGLVGLQGFCPVALREQHDLVDGRPEFLCVYRGRTYQVCSARAKARFDAAPSRYAPAARGYDVVLNSHGQTEVEGTLTNSIWYGEQLYLFSTPETAAEFNEDPTQYLVAE